MLMFFFLASKRFINNGFAYPFWKTIPCNKILNSINFNLEFFFTIYMIAVCKLFEIKASLQFHGQKLMQCVYFSVVVGLQYIPKPSRSITISKICGNTSSNVPTVNRRFLSKLFDAL